MVSPRASAVGSKNWDEQVVMEILQKHTFFMMKEIQTMHVPGFETTFKINRLSPTYSKNFLKVGDMSMLTLLVPVAERFYWECLERTQIYPKQRSHAAMYAP